MYDSLNCITNTPFLFKKVKNNFWVLGLLLMMTFIILIYSNFSKPTTASNDMGSLLIGLLLGAVIMFLVWKLLNKEKKVEVKENSHTVVESIRKVFKIVFAEGHFNELYNFEETRKLFGFIPSTKRALVIIKAKVLVGYDFKKCVWEVDEQNRKVKMISFPEPEILSIEPDYLYYNFDEGIFNLLGRDDLTKIQINGKRQVEEAAIKSHLPKIAADQMHTMLTEVLQSKNWQLEGSHKISEGNNKTLPSTNA